MDIRDSNHGAAMSNSFFQVQKVNKKNKEANKTENLTKIDFVLNGLS